MLSFLCGKNNHSNFRGQVKNALSAEVSLIIIANSQEGIGCRCDRTDISFTPSWHLNTPFDSVGPELFSMGGLDSPIKVPAVLISKESGVALRRCLEADPTLELSLRTFALPEYTFLHASSTANCSLAFTYGSVLSRQLRGFRGSGIER